MQTLGRSWLPLGSWTLDWAPRLIYLLLGVLDIVCQAHQLTNKSLFLFSPLFLSLKWDLCPSLQSTLAFFPTDLADLACCIILQRGLLQNTQVLFLVLVYPPLCYSLHKYLDTHSHQQNLPLIRGWFSICCLTFHWIFCCFPPSTKTSQLHRLKIVLSCFLVALWLILQDSKVVWVAWKKCLDHFPCYFRRKFSFAFTSFIVFTCCFLITHLIFMLTYNPLLTTVKEHCDERNTNLWKH